MARVLDECSVPDPGASPNSGRVKRLFCKEKAHDYYMTQKHLDGSAYSEADAEEAIATSAFLRFRKVESLFDPNSEVGEELTVDELIREMLSDLDKRSGMVTTKQDHRQRIYSKWSKELGVEELPDDSATEECECFVCKKVPFSWVCRTWHSYQDKLPRPISPSEIIAQMADEDTYEDTEKIS